MNSRALIPVLCVGAVAFACGPRARSDASAPAKGNATVASAASAPRQQGTAKASRKNAKTPVEALLSVHTIASTVELTLHVVNTSKKRVELTFPSGQTHDFVILDSAGREMWRWGNGRMFTQTFQNRLLSGGETLDVDGVWQPDQLAPGKYVARAILVSQNYPLVQQMEFTVTPATLASR